MTAAIDEPRETAATDRWVHRRLTAVWGLAVLNVLPYEDLPTIIPIPQRIGQLITQGSLTASFLLALTINRGGAVRRSLFLTFITALAVASLVTSLRTGSIPGEARAARYLLFVALLWLGTPFWGTLGLARIHQRCLVVIVATVGLGFAIAPGAARSFEGRLSGTIWPMPPTQVAHYCATLVGLTAIMWLGRVVQSRRALALIVLGIAGVLLTHTRTALVAMLVALLLASLSLFLTHRRARRTFAAAILVLGTSAVALNPVLVSWLSRGQDAEQISQLTGRTRVWEDLMSTPRPTTDRLIGSGASNGSFHGMPIDNGWLSAYLDQGLLGVLLVAAALVTLIVLIVIRPPGPARAMAVFLVAYCLIASFTETGIAGPTTYQLDLVVAASLLAAPVTGRAAGVGAAPQAPAAGWWTEPRSQAGCACANR